MGKKKETPTMTDVLREALAEYIAGGGTFLALETETRLVRASLARFLRGETSLRLDLADVLAKRLGVEARRVRRPKGA
jgi:hypothetical protein